jgi:hypothetical protein
MAVLIEYFAAPSDAAAVAVARAQVCRIRG